jgi:transposase
MKNQAALLSEHNAKDARLYLAIELSRKKWKLGFSDGRGVRARIRTIGGRDFQALGEEIEQGKKHFGLEAATPVVSCYEAGREGFWVHRALTEKGIDNIVVDAASIEVKRRKRAKTDRIDAESLVRKLMRYHAGEASVWSLVRVPSPEAEDGRQLHREIQVLQRERQQHRMRIQSLLFTQGVEVIVTPKLMRDLDQIRGWNGQPLGPDLKDRIQREYARLNLVKQDLVGLRKQQQSRLKTPSTVAMEKIRLMQQLCGIAMKSSWVFVMELFGWRQFHNRREVAAALGLTPMPYQSGDSAHEQGISRAGNRRVRAMAIEIAWSWLRYQPQSRLSRWYQQRFGSGGPRMRRIGIVAMARRLMIDLWRYVEFGIVPEGARLKAGPLNKMIGN